MKSNLSPANRIIRGIVGLAAIGAGVYYQSWWGAIGIIPILSAAAGYCPLCCGGGSCGMKKDEAKTEHKHGDGCCHH